MAKNTPKRRTQAERRAQSQQAVLESACRLFGEKGYANTSLEDIAADCGLTIRPIYHYFGNKKALFAAVNEHMEQRILDQMHTDSQSALENWKGFLELCEDAAFRQIVLIDSPNILGRERWVTSPVTKKALQEINNTEKRDPKEQFQTLLLNRVMMGAYAEAALAVAEADDITMARAEAEQLMSQLFSGTQLA